MKKYKIDLYKISSILVFYDLSYNGLSKILDINPSTISYWFSNRNKYIKKKSVYNKIELLYKLSRIPVLNKVIKWLI